MRFKQWIKVLTGAYVNKIVVNSQSGRVSATAVEFSYGGETHTVNVNKEAIVSSG